MTQKISADDSFPMNVKAAIALLFVTCATGCNGLLEPIHRPTVSVIDVRLEQQTLEGVRVRVEVALQNPNNVSLPLGSNRYTINLNPTGSYSFVDMPRLTLPAGGQQMLRMAAAFDTQGRDMQGAKYKITGAVQYNPPGQIQRLLKESGVPLPSVPYSASGTLQ